MAFRLRHRWAASPAAWRASLSPAVSGLVAGAFCLVVFGGTLFAMAVPPLINAQGVSVAALGLLGGSLSIEGNGSQVANANENASTDQEAGDAGSALFQSVSLASAPVLADLGISGTAAMGSGTV